MGFLHELVYNKDLLPAMAPYRLYSIQTPISPFAPNLRMSPPPPTTSGDPTLSRCFEIVWRGKEIALCQEAGWLIEEPVWGADTEGSFIHEVED